MMRRLFVLVVLNFASDRFSRDDSRLILCRRNENRSIYIPGACVSGSTQVGQISLLLIMIVRITFTRTSKRFGNR